MKFAVNFSKAAEKLINDQSVKVDMFKCPDFSRELIYQAERTRPCYVHFGLNAGNGQVHKVNWEIIDELIKQTKTPYVNLHAVAFAKDFPNIDVLTTDTSQLTKMIDATVRDIEFVAKKVGVENIIVENVICRGNGENMMRPIIDSTILSEIVNKTSCGFLLDTAHAQMTSICLGLDVQEYISQLPIHHLKELHITGIQADENGRLRDSMPMTTEDWDLATWAVQRIKAGDWQEPWVVAFEYGGIGPAFEWRTDEEVLTKQIPMLYNLVK